MKNPNKIKIIPSKISPDENKIWVKLNSENSFSKIQNSLVLAIGKVAPKNKVNASITLSMNQAPERLSFLSIIWNKSFTKN